MPHQCTGCGRQFADGSKEMLSGCPDCGGTKFQFMPDGGAPAAEAPPEPPAPEGGAVAQTVGQATAKLRDFVSDDPEPRDGTPDVRSPGGDDSGDGDGPGEAPAVEHPVTGAAVTDSDGLAVDEVGSEDGAQSSARSDIVSPDELPDDNARVGATTARVEEPVTGDRTEAEGFAPDAGQAATDADSTDTPTDPEGADVRSVPEDTDARVVDTPSEDRPDLADLREELNDQFEGIRICEPGEYELNLMELYEREETIIALQENGRYVIEPPESWHGDGGP